jgi:Fe-S oxidoreductase
MSLAFGWFMLICIGNLEAKAFSTNPINPPYYSIFFRFFEPNPGSYFFSSGFHFVMDLFLLMVLSGVALALFKRFRSKSFGMQQTTVHSRADKLALSVLWMIFPLRFLAESFTAGTYHTGSFLTGTAGSFFASFLPVAHLSYAAWWGYSLALGLFFIALPFSRYMHIPTEVLLIFFRNAGIKAVKTINSYSQVEIHSCSRCGICIDSCQLASSAKVNHVQSSYFIRDLRYGKLQAQTAENCLMCGRCNNACPVGIDTLELRYAQRNKFTQNFKVDYSQVIPKPVKKADVLFFAGCMTHLTPTIKIAMEKVLHASGVNYQFLDKDGSICCGRPLLLAGQIESARMLMDKNIAQIQASGAKTLVTSCPICYKMFKDEYKLKIEVLHHTQYIARLIDEEKIYLKKESKQVVYHDPCELGRGSNVYIEPRYVINNIADLVDTAHEYESSLCCGSSLGNTQLTGKQKNTIAADALNKMGVSQVDALITSCPLCKKAFEGQTEKQVMDISQLVAASIDYERMAMPKISARKPYEQHIEYSVN